MNPMTNIKNIQKLSNQELNTNNKTSWHDQYKNSAWIFIGGLPYDLTEGDIICVFSQYGEIVNINLVRDKDSGKSKGFCFLCYEDQRSTILAVDNLNALKILGRTVRVDHVSDYKAPDETRKNVDDETKRLYMEGCAPAVEKIRVKEEPIDLKPVVVGGVRLPPRLPIGNIKQEDNGLNSIRKTKKSKKDKKSKKQKKSKSKKRSHESSEDSDTDTSDDYKSQKEKKSKQAKKKSKTKKRNHESSEDSDDSDISADNKEVKSKSSKKSKTKKRTHKSSEDSEDSVISEHSSSKKRKSK